MNIRIYWSENNEQGYLEVFSPVMPLPEAKEKQGEMAMEMLILQGDLFGLQFYVLNNIVYLGDMREVRGLDASEFLSILYRVAGYSTEHGAIFRQKYGNN